VLRGLVARQRARGEPAFYHFVSDDDLAAIVGGKRAAGARVHAVSRGASGQDGASSLGVESLAAELGSLVEEIDALARARVSGRAAPFASAMGTADADAMAAVGLAHQETEGERARREARDRDERALSARFDAWFPPDRAADPDTSRAARTGSAVQEPERTDDDPPAWEGDVDAALVVLTALADVLADLGGTHAERRADAVDLLERLLPDARLSPGRYREVVRARPARIAAALSAVRGAVLGARGRAS
jgi:hypothetical protein